MAEMTLPQLLELGLRHFALGELERAKGAWKKALSLDPSNDRAQEYLRLVASVSTGPLPVGPEAARTNPFGEPPDGPHEEPEDPWAAAPAADAAPAEDWRQDDYVSPGPTGWGLEDDTATLDVRSVAGDGLSLVQADGPSVVPAAPARRASRRTGRAARSDADTLMEGARELFGLGDFSGSLELVQRALDAQPDHAEALAYLERNRDTLVQMYESKLGPLDARPRVVLRPDEIVWLNLDHRAGFLLAQIDGTVSIDDLYALSGLSRLDTAKILAELVEQGVVST